MTQAGFKEEMDLDGKKYLRAYTTDGKPGDWLAIADLFFRLEDETGKVLYDSRLPIPPDAVILPGYIGGSQR